MGDRIPIDDEARATIDSAIEDEKLAAWLNARHRSFWSRLVDGLLTPGILQLVLTSALIPIIGYLALTAYDKTPQGRRAAAAAKQAAADAQLESDARVTMSEVEGLVPLIKDKDSRPIARKILLARSTCHSSDQSPRCAILAVIATLDQNDAPARPDVPTSQGPPPPIGVTPAEKTEAANPLTAPRIAYIQIYADSQQAAAAKLAAALRSSGIAVPGVENVMNTHPDTAGRSPQRNFIGVRFFQPSAKPGALFTANLVRETLNQPASAQDVTRAGVTTQPDMVEIWFPKP